MNDIMKIVQAFEDSGISLEGVSETTKNQIKQQNGNRLGMILGTLAASLLGNLLRGKGTVRAGEGIKKISSNSTTSFNKF